MAEFNFNQFQNIYKGLHINTNSLGCIMLDVKPLSNMYSIEFEGAGIALYYAKNKERFWIDGWVVNKKAHITLLYGLMESGREWKNYVDIVLADCKIDEVEIGGISFFDSPYPDEPYYCIVAEIKITPELLEAHQRLELLPHINTFPGYKAHMTICYLSKSQGEGYRDRMIAEFNNLWKGKKLKALGINYGGKD